MATGNWRRQLFWFVGLWGAGVGSLFILALIIRLALPH